MRKDFPGYYPASSIDIDLSVEPTLVVFDANVLLNLYRYPTAASKDLLSIMAKIQNRVWLPHQVGLEYHRNRLNVVSEQNKRFKEARSAVEKAIASLEGELGKLQLKKRHSTIKPDKLMSAIGCAADEFYSELESQQTSHQQVSSTDKILEQLTSIFDGRVGSPPASQSALGEIEEAGKKRYESKVPPGFRDSGKEGEAFVHAGLVYSNKFGDLILWIQLLDKCKSAQIKQLVFVTDDDKDDWWFIVDSNGDKRIGPRTELIEELSQESEVETFVMLSSDRFAERFASLLEMQLESKTVAAVQDVKSTLARKEHVDCPNCAHVSYETLGTSAGSSAVHFCENCGERFHVHRSSGGDVFCREWGGNASSPRQSRRIEATCPVCSSTVPASIKEGTFQTERYCMGCCTLLKINSRGDILQTQPSEPVAAINLENDGPFMYLGCPNCPGHPQTRSIWGNGSIARAVCQNCSCLLESKLP
ncbi:MAG: PIN-like domain-containing protein [Pirellula sp.]